MGLLLSAIIGLSSLGSGVLLGRTLLSRDTYSSCVRDLIKVGIDKESAVIRCTPERKQSVQTSLYSNIVTPIAITVGLITLAPLAMKMISHKEK